MSEEVEIWVPVAGILYGHYEVSSLGRVRSLARVSSGKRPYRVKERILKSAVHPAGHRHLNLLINGKRYTRKVHHLVMEAFVGPRLHGLGVRHLNGNPSDNRLDNLAYGSQLDNMADTKRHDRTTKGERNAQAKLKESQVLEIKLSSLSASTLAWQHGVSPSNINHIRRGERWGHVQLLTEPISIEDAYRITYTAEAA